MCLLEIFLYIYTFLIIRTTCMLQSWIACKEYCLKEEINLKLMFLEGCDVLKILFHSIWVLKKSEFLKLSEWIKISELFFLNASDLLSFGMPGAHGEDTVLNLNTT